MSVSSDSLAIDVSEKLKLPLAERGVYYKDIRVGRPKNKRRVGPQRETRTRKQRRPADLRAAHAPSPSACLCICFFLSCVQPTFLCSTAFLVKNGYPIVPKFTCYSSSIMETLPCLFSRFQFQTQGRKSDWLGLSQCIFLGLW